MAEQTREVALTCIRAMLRPVIRLCLKHSLHIQDIIESAKLVFLEMAEVEMEKAGEKVSGCRLSTTTGIH